MKKVKYLKLYEEWSITGRMPKEGLCSNLGNWGRTCMDWDFSDNPLFLLMMPFDYKGGGTDYWASGSSHSNSSFNPLRQNIILFMAAMNGEL